jgi:Fur family transcriptional regulator, ferric uptake regulator
MTKASVGFERYRKILQSKGLRFTRERRAIVEEASHQKKHFDVDHLFETLRTKGHRMSRDTVYRNLPLLLESGLLQKSVGAGKGEYFEPTSSKGHHDHMVCISCGKVIEFQSEKIERHQEEICENYSFELLFHDHRLFGRCAGCRD